MATLSQLGALKVRPLAGSLPRNRSSAAFAFGGEVRAAAAPALTSPTPIAQLVIAEDCRAVSISAPFTWSGVQLGVQGEQLRCCTRDDRGRERGARELHVVG